MTNNNKKQKSMNPICGYPDPHTCLYYGKKHGSCKNDTVRCSYRKNK